MDFESTTRGSASRPLSLDHEAVHDDIFIHNSVPKDQVPVKSEPFHADNAKPIQTSQHYTHITFILTVHEATLRKLAN